MPARFRPTRPAELISDCKVARTQKSPDRSKYTRKTISMYMLEIGASAVSLKFTTEQTDQRNYR